MSQNLKKRVISFRSLAEKLQKQIDTKRSPAISTQNLTARRARIAAGMAEDADRLEEIQSVLLGMAKAIEVQTLPESLTGISNKKQVELLLNSVKYKQDFSFLCKYEADRKRLKSAKLEDQKTFEQAKKDIVVYIEGPSEEVLRKKALKEQERKLIGVKIPGFFPTPQPIIDKMFKFIDIQPGMSVLEPSAGKGDIVDYLKKKYPEIECTIIEQNCTLIQLLKTKGYAPIQMDFLEYEDRQYDYIIQNPPFEKLQDIDHVRHAYELLKPGGRLVSIMSEAPFFRQDEKAVKFRQWIEEIGYIDLKLKDAFKGAMSFRQTGVQSRIIVLDQVSKEELGTDEIKEEKENKMELTVDKKQLLSLLSQAQIGVKRGTYPGAGMIHLTAEKGSLTGRTTDLDVFFEGKIPAHVIVPGEKVLALKELKKGVSCIKSSRIHLAEDSTTEQSILKVDNTQILLPYAMSPEDYPVLPEKIKNDFSLKVPIEYLAEMLRKVVHSAAKKNEKYIFTTIKLQFEQISPDETILRMVATDGHRLSMIEKKIKGSFFPEMKDENILLPAEALAKLSRFFLNTKPKKKGRMRRGLFAPSALCTLKKSSQFLMFQKKDTSVVIRLVEGDFPSFDLISSAIPKEDVTSFNIARKALLTILVDMIHIQEHIILHVNETNLELSTLHDQMKTEIPIQFIEGKHPIKFTVNAKYLVDALKCMDSTQVQLRMKDISSPHPCQITGEQDPGFFELVMPFLQNPIQ